jgi:hypothetical protein
MTNNSEKFDAEMMVVADRGFRTNKPFLTTIVDADSGKETILGPSILKFLGLMGEIKRLKSIRKKTEITNIHIHQLRAELNDLVELFRENQIVSRKVLEVLTYGKVKVGLWVDSLGGEVDVENQIILALNYLDGQDALCHSYVTIKAMSAGFDLTFAGDKINTLTRSVLLWHLSDSPVYRRTKKVKQVKKGGNLPNDLENEMSDLFDTLNFANPESREEAIELFNRQFNHPHNPNGDVMFNGNVAKELGLVHEAHSSIKPLIDQYNSDFPLHARNSTVMNYTTRVAEEVYKIVRLEPDWTDEALYVSDKIQKRLEVISSQGAKSNRRAQ